MTKQGVEFETVNYIEHPLSADELRDLLRRAGLRPQEAIRTKEPAYQEFVAGKNLTDAELLKVMATHPELLQRPIVARDKQAVLARPVENLAKLRLE